MINVGMIIDKKILKFLSSVLYGVYHARIDIL